MACAASTEPADSRGPGDGPAPREGRATDARPATTGGGPTGTDPEPAPTFDPARPHRLHPQVALRPEPFGALAYHYGNRRLTFVRSPEVVALLRDLHHHDSVHQALAVSPISEDRRPAVLAALGQLCTSEMICAC